MRGDSWSPRPRRREVAASSGARRPRRRSHSPCELRPVAQRASPTPMRSEGGSVSPRFSDDDGDLSAQDLAPRGGTRRVRRRRRRRVGGEDGFEHRGRRRARPNDRFDDSASMSPAPRGARGCHRRGGRGAEFSDDSRRPPGRRRGGRRRANQNAEDAGDNNYTSGVNAIPLGNRRRDASGADVEGNQGNGDETTMRVFVMHTDCAKVIGRGGRAMREVEATSRTKLKVQPERDMVNDSKERYVDITGSPEEQQHALKLLLDLTRYCREDGGKVLKDTRAAEGADGVEEPPMVVEVRPDDVGRVIGRKGETVKVLERDSGTKIEVDKISGRLEIFGKPEAQKQALELILAEVSFAKDAEGNVLKEETRAKKDSEDAAKTPPLVIWVKDSEAGKVIGRGGETIHEIMRKSCTDIKVQKLEEMRSGVREREIRIFGEKEQQDEALTHLLQEVSWCRDAGGMLKEPPEDKRRLEERKRRKEEREARKNEPAAADADKVENKEGGPEESSVATAADAASHKKSGRKSKGGKGGGGNSGLWVCATCGGDHRTKECPHAQAFLGMGVQIGMQMGMQAMGMQAAQMGLPPGIMPPPLMPPMMGMPGMPGMPGRPPRGGRGGGAHRSGSEYSYSGSSACDSRASSASGAAMMPREPHSGAPERPRKHRPPPSGYDAGAPPKRGKARETGARGEHAEGDGSRLSRSRSPPKRVRVSNGDL